MFVFVAASQESTANQAFGRWIFLNWTHISPTEFVMEKVSGLGFGQREQSQRTDSRLFCCSSSWELLVPFWLFACCGDLFSHCGHFITVIV